MGYDVGALVRIPLLEVGRSRGFRNPQGMHRLAAAKCDGPTTSFGADDMILILARTCAMVCSSSFVIGYQ